MEEKPLTKKQLEQLGFTVTEKQLKTYKERLSQIANERFWNDREEAVGYGRESELEDVISDLKAILRENKS
jgi:hypothetical protein